MPGVSQPDPEEEFQGSEDGSLTAEEVAALAAADRAEDDWWPPAGSPVVPQQPADGLRTADGGRAEGFRPVDGGRAERLGLTDGERAAWLGLAGGQRADGLGLADGELAGGGCPDGGVGAGFAEGEVLDSAVPSVLLAREADQAYQGRNGLDDDRLGGLARAYRRLASQAQARELALVAELARRRPQPGTPPAADDGGMPDQVSEFLGDEVAALLTLTSRAASSEVGLALGLAARWRTAAALESGRIDMPKALVLLDLLGPVGEVAAAAIEAAVLPIASGLTTAQLRAWVMRLILDVDPAAARRRRDTALRQAHVACWTDPEGTATLAGRYLPPAQVLAADRRLCAIATAWKKLGAQGGMDLLRAHAYMALLLGHDPSTPPLSLLVPSRDSSVTSDLDPGPAPSAGPAPSPGPAPSTGSAPSPGPAPSPGSGSAPAPAQGPVVGQDSAPVSASAAVPAPQQTGAAPPPFWLTGTVNVTVPLATLLGLADRPGEAAGFGPLHADTARELATGMSAHPATRWNVIITDPTGRAMGFGGPARARRTAKVTARGDPARPDLGKGSLAAEAARGSPTPFGARGWTITVTTRPIAPYY